MATRQSTILPLIKFVWITFLFYFLPSLSLHSSFQNPNSIIPIPILALEITSLSDLSLPQRLAFDFVFSTHHFIPSAFLGGSHSLVCTPVLRQTLLSLFYAIVAGHWVWNAPNFPMHFLIFFNYFMWWVLGMNCGLGFIYFLSEVLDLWWNGVGCDPKCSVNGSWLDLKLWSFWVPWTGE